MPNVKCKICKKEFYAKPSWLKNGLGKYCSRNCMQNGLRKGAMKKCHICGTEIYKSRKALLRSKSKKFFCGKSCQAVWRNSMVNIGINHPNWKGGKWTYKRVLLKSDKPRTCKLCKNDDPRVLAVHHIDNNNRNNDLNNLIWLCNNCHVLIHHYKKEASRLKKALTSENA